MHLIGIRLCFTSSCSVSQSLMSFKIDYRNYLALGLVERPNYQFPVHEVVQEIVLGHHVVGPPLHPNDRVEQPVDRLHP